MATFRALMEKNGCEFRDRIDEYIRGGVGEFAILWEMSIWVYEADRTLGDPAGI